MCLCDCSVRCFGPKSKKKLLKYKHQCSQPCFGFFLQGSAKETAIANSFVAVASMIIFGAGIAEFLPRFQNEEHAFKRLIRPFFWTFYYSYWAMEIYLSFLLYLASKARDRTKCMKWLQIQLVFFIIWLILFIAHSTWLNGFNVILQACFGVISLYKLYTFWVIKCFINQMKVYGSLNGPLARLNDEDLEEFEKGHDWKSLDPKEKPYNRNFEIPISQLNDRDCWIEIGSGYFGTVYHAKYYGNSKTNDSVTDVAVKIVNSIADICYFKALLSELKIMTYIGTHENIVNLIGASTANIRERKLDLIVEFCPYGNMEIFLQTRRGFFDNQVDPDGRIISDPCEYMKKSCTPSMPDTVTTLDLVRWSKDTAKGLEFLHQKEVIHGDLAARNVLLTQQKVAKISDFGLSRRVYTYRKNTVYDTTPRLLPWRWLSPETLNMNLRFTRESDRWSYGVMLWEFFCLGSCIPYNSSHLEFTKAFVTQLQNGLILERPHFCPSSMYDIMKGCWEIDPRKRKEFPEIICAINSVIDDFQFPNNNNLETDVSLNEPLLGTNKMNEQNDENPQVIIEIPEIQRQAKVFTPLPGYVTICPD